MPSLWRQALLKLCSLEIPPISLRGALGLSLVVHAMFFCLAAVLVTNWRSSYSGATPLLLEFAFMPGNELSQTHEPAALVPTESQRNAREVAGAEKTSSRDESRPQAAQHGPASSVNEESLPSLEHTDFALPEEKFELKTAPPAMRARSAASPLAPALLPLTPKEGQKLTHEIAKLSTRAPFFTQRDTSLKFETGGKSYVANVRHLPASSATGIDEVEVTLTTDRNGQQWQTQVRMMRLAFSHFAQFVDYWDPHVAIHDDKLDGRFHTNSSFSISSSKGVRPKFQGKVTTAAFDIRQAERWGVANDKEIFQGGLETGAREIRMPGKSNALFQTAGLADSLCHRFEEEAWITFHRDGSYSWRSAAQAQTHARKLPRQPFLLAGGKNATLHVQGVVCGKVLVQSEKRIVIDDDLIYARAPEVFSDSEDYLGLVCRKNISIAPPKVTGPGDLRIYAAILAEGRFEVTHLYSEDRATLHIYGSLSAGSLSATEPRYATHVRFDKRLEQRRPPYFPMTDRYEITDWQPEWKMVMPEGEEQK